MFDTYKELYNLRWLYNSRLVAQKLGFGLQVYTPSINILLPLFLLWSKIGLLVIFLANLMYYIYGNKKKLMYIIQIVR